MSSYHIFSSFVVVSLKALFFFLINDKQAILFIVIKQLNHFVYLFRIDAGAQGKQWRLTFRDKLEIAIGISQGLNYMHSECPQGPVAHGDLKMSNVYLRSDLQPQVKNGHINST